MPKPRFDKDYYIKIGNNLRETRVNKGLTQDYMSEQLGVTFQQIQKYEKGHNRISIEYITKWAEITGTTRDYLTNHECKTVPLENRAKLLLINLFDKMEKDSQLCLLKVARIMNGEKNV